MAKISFRLQGTKNPVNIYIRLSDGRKCDLWAKTGLVIDRDEWSEKKQQPKRMQDADMRNLHVRLENIKFDLLTHYNDTEGTKDRKWIEAFLNPESRQVPTGLVEYIDYYLEAKGNDLKPNTKKKFTTIKSKLIAWGKNYAISEVNDHFKNEFKKWSVKMGYAENTFIHNLKGIKTVCHHAKERGMLTTFSKDFARGGYKKASGIILAFSEIDAVRSVDLSGTLDEARDWLVISCYTGQRVSDFMRFEKKMCVTIKGVRMIQFNQNKTENPISLPLHPVVIEILDKRGGDFPRRISDQRYNEFIKEVCKKSGIDEPVVGGVMDDKRKKHGVYPKYELVTSHVGRRSFATNFYGKIPTPLLMSATGHKTEKTFLIYIGKSDADMAVELASWF